MSGIGDKRAAENWRHVLSIIGAGREISGEGIRFAMDQTMPGASGDVRTATFVFDLPAKGVTAAELDAAAERMSSFVRPVRDSQLAGVTERGAVDIVGTDGDGANTVNISAMSMIVIAASGVSVLKHGSRAASSRPGSVDMLETLGIDIEDGFITSPEHPDFYTHSLFAARFYPAMRFAGPVRRELAVPTVSNLLGPLTNPARPQANLIGRALEDQMGTMANTFARRGQRALAVRRSDGLDEITVIGLAKVFIVEDGEVAEDVIDPHDYGMEYSEIDALRGGDPVYNTDVARRIWAGELEGPIRDVVILSFAVVIAVSRGPDGRSLEEATADSTGEVEETFQSGLCPGILTAVTKG